MRYFIEGRASTSTIAKLRAEYAAHDAGMDPREFHAIWARCHCPGEEGEYARDDLSNITTEVELQAA